MSNSNSVASPKLSLSLIVGLGLVVLVMVGLVFAVKQPNKPLNLPDQAEPTSGKPISPVVSLTPIATVTPPDNFTELKAFKLADTSTSACAQVGMVGAPEVYNPNSQTWWFKLVPNEPKDGCSPACVVHLNGKVEVNWRCTGLKTP